LNGNGAELTVRLGAGRRRKKRKSQIEKTPPLQKTQGWATQILSSTLGWATRRVTKEEQLEQQTLPAALKLFLESDALPFKMARLTWCSW
jgi:hypothetical protein